MTKKDMLEFENAIFLYTLRFNSCYVISPLLLI